MSANVDQIEGEPNKETFLYSKSVSEISKENHFQVKPFTFDLDELYIYFQKCGTWINPYFREPFTDAQIQTLRKTQQRFEALYLEQRGKSYLTAIATVSTDTINKISTINRELEEYAHLSLNNDSVLAYRTILLLEFAEYYLSLSQTEQKALNMPALTGWCLPCGYDGIEDFFNAFATGKSKCLDNASTLLGNIRSGLEYLKKEAQTINQQTTVKSRSCVQAMKQDNEEKKDQNTQSTSK